MLPECSGCLLLYWFDSSPGLVALTVTVEVVVSDAKPFLFLWMGDATHDKCFQ